MSSIAADMIGGYNTFIKTQKETPGECVVSFYQFDDIYEAVFERVNLQDVTELNSNTYVPRNRTALYDAMGKTVNSYGAYLASLAEEDRPERVLFVTITDGHNNASVEFTVSQVGDMVKHQTEVYNWSFVFLGSNIDAWDAGKSLNMAASSTLQFANSKGSVDNAFSSLTKSATLYRCSAVPVAYSFEASDLAAQDQFLDDKLKSKNKEQQNQSPKATSNTK